MRLPLIAASVLAGSFASQAQAQISSQAPAPSKPVVQKPAPSNTPTPQLVTTMLVGGSDNCINASTNDAINGPGVYAVDNTAATSGAPLGTCGLIGRDVWFYYTATATGIATVSTCNQVGADSVIAVWQSAGPGTCPTTQITCLDDFCGLQTQISFPITAGTSYYLELGSYNNGTGYSGTFTITESIPAGNDACSAAVNVVGAGPHPFDTTSATTGAEGQSDPLCLAFGSTAIYKDLWFTWTAPATGQFEVSLCGATAYDSRVAVYTGSGCPTGGAIACNDDSCGLISAACFAATSGQTYTIQIGAYGATGGGPGDFLFTLVPPAPSACTPGDDGTSENSVGWVAGFDFGWMVGFGSASSGATSISAIETCFGTPLFPGGYVPSGPVSVAVYDDPNDDGNPNDLVLVGTVTQAVVSPGSVDTDVLQQITLGAPVVVNGVFFLGASVSHAAGEFPAPLDQSGGGGSACAAGVGSWYFGNNAGAADMTNPNANVFPPATIAGAGLPGNWLLRPVCGAGSVGTPYCFGDGSGTACPCGNAGTAGNGCASSVNPNGANLAATGSAVVASDTVVLNGSGMAPTGTALYFQGTAQLNAVFGDGLRCVGGTVIRLGTKTNVGGASQYPAPGDLSVSVRGGVSAGQTRHYQVWYRNAAAFCTPSTFNLANGLTIVWQ